MVPGSSFVLRKGRKQLMAHDPWPHQQRAIDQFWGAVENGKKRICLSSPTGGGKTFISSLMIKEALARQANDRGWNVVFSVNRKSLAEQTRKSFEGFGLDPGMRASGYKASFDKPLQISMTPTENTRALGKNPTWGLHGADLVFFDEAHNEKSARSLALIAEYERNNPNVVFCGLTATPLDIGNIYDTLIVAGTNSELRECGAHLLCKEFCPTMPDFMKMKRNAEGEFSEKTVEKAMKPEIVFGHILPHYRRLNPMMRPTIVFAPSVKGSITITDMFLKAGIPSAHIDAKHIYYGEKDADGRPVMEDSMKIANREKLFDEVRTGEIKTLSNRFLCLDSETEILTEDGWAGIDEMTANHSVANWENGKIYFSKPKRVMFRERLPDERMVTLEEPRISIRVTEGHDMLVSHRGLGEFNKIKARDIVGKSLDLPVNGIAEPSGLQIDQPVRKGVTSKRITKNSWLLRHRTGMGVEESKIEAEKRIRRRESLLYKQPQELSKEECEFIGFWVGDGQKTKLKKGGVEYLIQEGEDYTNITERIEYLIASIGVDSIKRIKTTEKGKRIVSWSFARGTGFGSQVRKGLFHLEPYLEKRGTKAWTGFSERQFESFLKGLWMANGRSHGNNTSLPERFVICSAKPELFDAVQQVAVCRGYRASIRDYPNGKGNRIYLLSMSKAKKHSMVSCRFEFDDEFKRERVWCVTTDSGNIVTRRKGSVTVMGNCTEGIDLPQVGHLIFATSYGSLKMYLQAGGRLLRAHDSLDTVTAQDHGANCLQHGSLNDDRIWDLGDSSKSLLEKTLKERKDGKAQEPIICPKCGSMRLSGPACHECGHKSSNSGINILQHDGTLRQMKGPYVTRKANTTSDAIKAWNNIYFPSSKSRSSKSMTFKQALAQFKNKNKHLTVFNTVDPKGRERVAAAEDSGKVSFLPMMPPVNNEYLWSQKVRDVPKKDLL